MENKKPTPTSIYGSVPDKSKLIDIYEILKDKIFNYKLSKIKTQSKSNKGLYGIQFIYRNLIDGKEASLINIQSKEKDLIEQEFDLNGDSIINLQIWINEDYYLSFLHKLYLIHLLFFNYFFYLLQSNIVSGFEIQ